MSDDNNDPYSFLPNDLDKETASKLLRSTPNKSVPETIEEFENFTKTVDRKPVKTLTFGPTGAIDLNEQNNEQTEIKEKVEPRKQASDYSELKDKININSSSNFFETNAVSANPLTQFYRTPDMFVHIPSRGIFNEKEDFNLTVNGQIGIYPMTAKDEIVLRTPDALLNGAALEQLIKSCAPGVKNVRDLPSPDFDVILLAIRSVSVGPELEYDVKCPHCSEISHVGVDIPAVLDTVTAIKQPKPVVLKSGVKVHVKPYTFDSNVKVSMVAFEESQLIRAVSQQDITEEEKLLQFNESFTRISDLNRVLFANAISKIETPDGAVVVEKSFIKEFIENISKQDYTLIEEKIKELNNSGFQRKIKTTCNSCEKEHDVDVNYDPTRFFGNGF